MAHFVTRRKPRKVHRRITAEICSYPLNKPANLVGLVIHGAATAYTAVGTSALSFIFDFRTWGLVAISFAISLLIGIALMRIVDKLTPKIPFLSVNKSPLAVGIYVFGYLIFFGLILHAALTTPL